jgi:hypothetical protein
MATKTYRIQIVWNDIGNGLAHVAGKIEWDRDDERSVPHLLCEDGSKVAIDKRHLKEVNEREFDFVYETPGFNAGKGG